MSRPKEDSVKNCMLQMTYWNTGLVKAIGYSHNIDDLRNCIRQAHGIGSERFRTVFNYVLSDKFSRRINV